MNVVHHSVTLQTDLCKGCTHCIKRCPTEAIRVRDGKAVIKSERCIDCGECIRTCPHQAKRAIYDTLDKFKDYKYKIALPAPALYGQFDKLEDIDYIISGLYRCGFDDVFEVARAAELVSEYTRQYMKNPDIVKPVISSACPVVVRLISVRFPSLIDNVIPLLPPVELAARLAKEEAIKKHPDLKKEDICVLFISPCPAKVSYAKNPIGLEKSEIDGVLAMRDLYFMLVSEMNKIDNPTIASRSGIIGISWAGSGGESSALMNDKYLAADGIENVIHVLDEIEKENIRGIEFVELNACNGGCVGGALTVENPYIAKTRLQSLRRYLPVSLNHVSSMPTDGSVPDDVLWDSEIDYLPVMSLDTDRTTAMKKMTQIQKIAEDLCDFDCGSCGAPTCRALAEDIVNGEASISDCIIRMRQKLGTGGESK
ncbi:MAG: 4Fe-4S dicluster domain-containing protein [Ruminococcaceae bacterium]|nr:4Fe-4S dicluster domain-containing protein [Oscillospiraceae bacterium]